MRTISSLLMLIGLGVAAGLFAAERTYVSEDETRCFAWTENGPSQGHWECDAENQQCFCVVDPFTGWDPVTNRPIPRTTTTCRGNDPSPPFI